MRFERPMLRTLALSLLLGAGVAGEANGQSLAQRIAATRTGTVRFEYPAAEGVCGNGRGNISVRRGTGSSTYSSGNSTRGREWEDECEPGPVRVALDLDRGEVTEVRAYVGGRWRNIADSDLGAVSAREASDYLLTIAERGASGPAKEAVFPATIAQGVVVWDRLLRIAKDTDRPRDVRNSALFWVGQAAGEAATKGLQEIVDDPNGDQEVRKSAVFSLSQSPKDEAVPALIRIAQQNKDPEIRRNAIFWLAQTRDPRALEYFESVLTKGRP
jgi:hypothetical protein